VILAVGMGFLLVGCSDTPGTLLAPGNEGCSPAAPSVSLTKAGGSVGSASGSGVVTTSWCLNVTFSFTVHAAGDGNCGGQYEMHYADENNRIMAKIPGTVKGAKFYGNAVMFYAEQRTEFFPEMYGEIDCWEQIFVATDKGEGVGSAPDRMSNAWLTNDVTRPGGFDSYWSMTATEFLANAIPAEWGGPDYPLLRGNIQVRSTQ
jgi:hypothetical protein